MPLDTSIKKVLVIGSGPIVIGQAAEFDYAGAQACRILKEAGVNVVLCNSNPATIMTDQAMADEIYLEPLTTETIKRIILKERPDSILVIAGKEPTRFCGVNIIGLRRHGFSNELIDIIHDTYRTIYAQGIMKDGIAEARAKYPDIKEVEYICSFIESSKRGVIR